MGNSDSTQTTWRTDDRPSGLSRPDVGDSTEAAHVRLWSGTFLVRTVMLLLLAASSLVVRAPWTALALVGVVIPFNLTAQRSMRRHGVPPTWLGADLVLAALMSVISPQVFVGTTISMLTNSGVGTLACGKRRIVRFAAIGCGVLVIGGLVHGETLILAFVGPLFACCIAISRVVDYVDGKQLANSARFEDLLDGIHAAVYEIDVRSGDVIYANRHSIDLLGVRPSVVTDLLEVVHADDRDKVAIEVRDAIEARQSTRLDLRVVVTGATRFLELRSTLSRKGQKTRLRLVLVDVSDRKNIELEMAHRALHDALTDLPNRTMISERMNASITPVAEDAAPHAVLMLDLDSFKDVNDGLGHHHGDLLLVEIADRLRRIVRPIDTVARLGGDEFAVWLEGCDEHGAREIAERIRREVSLPHDAEGVAIVPEVSIGIACYPADALASADLLRLADMAMYRAKRSGTGYALYQQEFDSAGADRLVLQAELRAAIAESQLEAFFQPLVESASGRIVSCEALVRWRHPTKGMLTPTEFWPMVQSSGLSADVARFMLTAVFSQLRAWVLEGIAVPTAVNLSAGDISDPSVMSCISEEFGRGRLPSGLLTVELTEAELIKQTRQMRAALFALQELGVPTAVDDFGTGYSSLAWLRDLPVTTVKIDRSFVESICVDDRTRAIVRSTIELARDLHLSTVGEGVEDRATASALTALGCDRMQGYLFSRPVPSETMRRLLHDGLPHLRAAVDVPAPAPTS